MNKILYFLLFTSICFAENILPDIEYDKLTFGNERTLEIMTWNLQKFPKTEHTVSYAAKIISAINADIIGFSMAKPGKNVYSNRGFEFVKIGNRITYTPILKGEKIKDTEALISFFSTLLKEFSIFFSSMKEKTSIINPSSI